jgi:hypothetical protein
MFEIPEAWHQILEALIAAPVAWQAPKEVARAVGRDVEETTDTLCEMDVAGWIAVWDIEPAPLVTLTPLAAHRYHVVLVEIGPDEIPRWSAPGEPTPNPPKAKNVSSTDYYAGQDRVCDSFLSPDLVMERAELVARRAARYRQHLVETCRVDDLPLPFHFLGQYLSPWPARSDSGAPDVCPVCADRSLSPHVYCLYCDRWGLDDVLEALVARSEKAEQGSDSPSPESTPNQSASLVTDSSPKGRGSEGERPRYPGKSGIERSKRRVLKSYLRKVRAARR